MWNNETVVVTVLTTYRQRNKLKTGDIYWLGGYIYIRGDCIDSKDATICGRNLCKVDRIIPKLQTKSRHGYKYDKLAVINNTQLAKDSVQRITLEIDVVVDFPLSSEELLQHIQDECAIQAKPIIDTIYKYNTDHTKWWE